jgi:hypothetical protein
MILRKIIYKNFIKASQDRQILSNLYGKIILKQKSKSFGNARSSQNGFCFNLISVMPGVMVFKISQLLKGRCLKMRTTGKFAAAILSAIMMANGLSLPMAYAAPSSRYVSVDEKYDPFAEEEMPAKEADPSKLTFKERLELQKKEEQAAAQKVTIANVMPGHIYIPKKTMLNVELIEPANSKTHKKNQQVEFKTTENLIINGVVVIPKGTVGMGYVYEVQKAGGFGRKGVLRIAGKEIKTLNNVSVPLRKGLEGKGKTDGGAVAVAAAVSLVGGLFMKGSNINYPAGTDFQVEVRDNVDLGVTPEELKDAMNPDIPHGQEIVIEVK